MKKFSPKQRVYDRWWPFRVGTVVKVLKTRMHVQWSNGEIWRYDRAHTRFLELLCLLLLVGCTDTPEKPRRITCFSGGQVIYKSEKVGNIFRHSSSWSFTDLKTGKEVDILADCVAEQ